MSDVFEEVEESLRTEKAKRTWSRAAPFVYGVSALIVLAVGGREYFAYRDQTAIAASAESFERGVAALQAGDIGAAKAAFNDTIEAGSGYGALASHFVAELELTNSGDSAAAIDALAKAPAETGALGDLAMLKAAYMRADEASFAALEADLAPMVEAGGAFGALARELIAAKAHQEGDLVRARREYSLLTLDLDAPPGLQQRAELALSVIPVSPAAIETPDDVSDAAPEDKADAGAGASADDAVSEEDPS